MGDDKDTMPDSQCLMYARGLCVGYPLNILHITILIEIANNNHVSYIVN